MDSQNGHSTSTHSTALLDVKESKVNSKFYLIHISETLDYVLHLT